VDIDDPPRAACDAERLARERFEAVVGAVLAASDVDISFMAFERQLRDHLFALGRTLVVLFLVLVEQRVTASLPSQVKLGARTFRKAPAQTRNFNTMFGVVRYSRLYMREVVARSKKKLRGHHPLDAALGLGADRMSMNILALATRLATKMSFAEARCTLALFVPTAPSTEVIEQTMLGLGRHTQRWFEECPAPADDGDVLVIEIDSKGAPTATPEELKRRRGPRKPRPEGTSPRHRGRARRGRYPKKPRRKKGDKSKNAKMATMVVMYTLKRVGDELHGPINRRVYASFARKEHAFFVARREANKRGFEPGSGKTIQLVTDGERCFASYKTRWFPEATHTVDVMHIIEKLWAAGECIFREGTDELKAWIDLQRERLYDGRVHLIVDELRGRLGASSKSGPGTKWKRHQLARILRHIIARVDRMNYRELLAADLEIGTGMVEGAIKHVIGKRCDHGGMRWIKERAEAVLQLRCIEINGDWDAFIARVHDDNRRAAIDLGERRRLQTNDLAELPKLKLTHRAA
jgi:hypothetical protein